MCLIPTTVQLIDPADNTPKSTVTIPGEGVYTVDPNSGEVTFTPEDDFTGTATPITYQAEDDNGDQVTATITITVDPTPTATPDTVQAEEDTPVSIDILSNDESGDGIDEVTIVTAPDPTTEGVLTYIDDNGDPQTAAPGDTLSPEEAATLAFTPAAGVTGTLTDVFTYTITDDDGDVSDPAGVTVVVDGRPDALDDNQIVPEGAETVIDLLGNDPDVSDVVSVTIDSVPPASQGQLLLNGVPVSAGDVIDPADLGGLVFVPADDFTGVVDPIQYTVTDSDGDTDSAIHAITVNPLPETQDDALIVKEDLTGSLPVFNNDDLGDGTVSVVINNLPPAEQGTLVFTDANGVTQNVVAGVTLTEAEAVTLRFVPFPNFEQTVDPISYTVTDANGDTSTSFINITLDPAPDVVDDLFQATGGIPQFIDILANDEDGIPNNGVDLGDGLAAVRFETVPGTDEGVLTYTDANGVQQTISAGDVLTPEEVATLTFTPNAAFVGTTAGFTYTVIDLNGDEDSAEVVIEVAAPAQPQADPAPPVPTALDDEEPLVDTTPIVGSTVEATAPLGSQPSLVFVQSPISEALDDLDDLNGIPLLGEDNIISDGVIRWLDFEFFNDSSVEGYSVEIPKRTAPESFSVVLSNSIGGAYNIDGYSRDGVVTIEFKRFGSNGLDLQGGYSMTATMADGSSLPEWLSASSDGLLYGTPPADKPKIVVRIVLRDGDTVVIATLQINTATGEIILLSRETQVAEAAMFSTTITALASESSEETEALIRALS